MNLIKYLCLFLIICFTGCKKDAPAPKVELVASDLERLQSYNKLTVLKEGVWYVNEWKELAKKICEDSNGFDCSILAEIYHDRFYGYGSKTDIKKSIEILSKSCNLNDSKSCLQLAIIKNSESEEKNVNNIFIKSYDLALERCDNNHAIDCYVLALILFNGYGPFERDRLQGKNYALKACNLKYAESCVFSAINSNDYEESVEMREKACNLGINEYCDLTK